MPRDLPQLPEHWSPPFAIFGWQNSYCVTNGDEDHTAIIDDLGRDEAVFLAELLNHLFTSPTPTSKL